MILRTILCVGQLQIDATSIGTLFRETRSLCEAAKILGAIVSDGERIAHVLHGPQDRVMQVLARTSTDPRLSETAILAQLDVDDDGTKWPLSGWKAGWATPDVLDEMTSWSHSGSADAFPVCLSLLGRCDLL